MINVGVYYRVSTDRQDLASQKLAIRKWLDEHQEEYGEAKIHEFVDKGISGKTNKRPGYQKMLRAAYEGQIRTIIVYRLDRISRNATEAIQTLLSLDQAGVMFVSITQPVLNMKLDNPFRRTMLAAFSEIAEIERETIVSRVKAGIEAAKTKGVSLGRPKKVTSQLQEKARNLRSQGLSYTAIASMVGVSHGTVQKLIKGPDIQENT